MSRIFGVALLLSAGWSAQLRGQDAAAWRDSVQRIEKARNALRDSLIEQDSTVTEVLRRGTLVVSASSQNHRRAVAAFEALDTVRTRWFGGASPSSDGFRIVLSTSEPAGIFRRFSDANTSQGRVIVTGLPDTGGTVRDHRNISIKDVGLNLVAAFSEIMYRTLGPSMQSWLQNPPPLHLAEPDRRYLVMYGVMTGADRAARGCVAGVLVHCAEALGLRTVAGTDPTAHFAPLVRADLLLTALETGGPEAWTRLRAAGNVNMEDALAAAAGMPGDSLLARWRNGVVSLRPAATPLEAKRVLAAAFWTSVLLAGTLGAARWR